MNNRQFNVTWTPGVSEHQSLNLSYDGTTFAAVVDTLMPNGNSFLVVVSGDATNVSVKIGSHAPGQDPVYSEICILISPAAPLVLTPATNVKAEEVF